MGAFINKLNLHHKDDQLCSSLKQIRSMSQFNLPRINFHGSGLLDTPTANNGYINQLQIFNQDKSQAFVPPRILLGNASPPAGAKVFDAGTAGAYIHPLGIDETNFQEWCTYPLGTYPADSSYLSFYQAIDNAGMNPGYWNYYGDISMTLDKVLVTGITVPDNPNPGSPVGLPKTYNSSNIQELQNNIAQLMGAELSFNKDYFTPGSRTSAYMCDVDSEGQLCTQIFCGEAGLYDVVDGKNVTYFKGQPVKSTVRFMNLNRVLNYANMIPMGGSASFFTTIEDTDNELVKLFTPLAGGDEIDGIFIKLLIHEVYEVRNPLYSRMPTVEMRTSSGNKVNIQKNPAKISITGSITPWRKTGMKTASISRILKNPLASPLALNVLGIPDPMPYGENKSLGMPSAVNLAPIPFAGNSVQKIVSFDFCNMLLEYGTNPGNLPTYAGISDIQPYQDFVNYDFAEDINISFLPDDGSGAVIIGSLYSGNYSMSQFIINAGVYDFTWTLQQSPLEGTFSAWHNENEMWKEIELYLVSDQAGIYAEQNPTAANTFMSDGLPKGPCTLRVFKRGVPVPAANAFNFTFQACNLNTMSFTNMSINLYDGAALTLPVSDSGCITYVFPTTTDEQFPTQFSMAAFVYLAMNSCMVVCRVLADDPSLAPYLKGEQVITWNVVYEKVLKLYKMIYPIMDVILPINEATWSDAAIGEKIKYLTNEDNWQYPLFMPITRDMSAAQRKLLWMWIDQVNCSNAKAHAEKN
jgi:hypothetical protein